MAAAVWLALAWCSAAAILVVLARSGLPDHRLAISTLDVVQTWCLAAGLILVVPIAQRAAGAATWGPLAGVPAMWSVVMALVLVAPIVPLLPWFVAVIVIAGLGYVVTTPVLSASAIAALIAAGAAFAGVHMLTLFHLGYAHPLALEATLIGAQHPDTLFHATIVAFLMSDGMPSIGLDGVRPLAYHILSHRIVAGLAFWTGTAPVNTYSLFVPIVAVPLMIFHLLWAAAALARAPRRALPPALAAIGLVGWVYLVAALGIESFWVSESYIVSLWAMLGALITLDAALSAPTRRVRIVATAMVAALVVIASLSKISTGAVLACGVGMGFAVAGRFRLPAMARGFAAGPLPFLAAALLVPTAGTGEPIFNLFATWRTMRDETAFHVVFVAAMLGLAIRKWPTDPVVQAMVAALATMMLASVSSALLLDLPGGSALYFANPGVWAGLCLIPLLAVSPPWMRANRPRVTAALLAVGLVLVLLEASGTRHGWSRMADLREGILVAASPETPQTPFLDVPLNRILRAAAGTDAVHVTPGPSAFWDLTPQCWTALLTIPAMTGIPNLLGHPSADSGCAATPYYGFGDYAPAPERISDTELCQAASDRGLRNLLIVSPVLDLRSLDCSTNTVRPTETPSP